MRLFLFLIAAAAYSAGNPPATEIVKRALERDRENWLATLRYTFIEQVVQKDVDDDGRVKSSKSRTYDITMLEGEPYRRLVTRNDKPLPPDEERKEQEKLQNSIEARSKETPEETAKRLKEREKRHLESREFLNEIPEAFDFQVVGEERMAGRDTFIVEGTPRPGYKPRARKARFFPHLKGRLWIDKADYSLIRGEAEVIDTISYALFIVRVAEGTKILFEQVRVNDEVWLPRRIEAHGSARIGLIKKVGIEYEITYRNYRRFQADSRVVGLAQ